jgi:hypothetical protein
MVQCAKHGVKCFAQSHRFTMTKLPRHRFRSLCGLAGPSWSCRDQGSRAALKILFWNIAVRRSARAGDAAIVSLYSVKGGPSSFFCWRAAYDVFYISTRRRPNGNRVPSRRSSLSCLTFINFSPDSSKSPQNPIKQMFKPYAYIFIAI